MEQRHFAGSMPLLTPNLSFMTRDGHKAFISSTIFMNCGGKTSLGGQGRYILKTHQELPFPSTALMLKFPLRQR